MAKKKTVRKKTVTIADIPLPPGQSPQIGDNLEPAMAETSPIGDNLDAIVEDSIESVAIPDKTLEPCCEQCGEECPKPLAVIQEMRFCSDNCMLTYLGANEKHRMPNSNVTPKVASQILDEMKNRKQSAQIVQWEDPELRQDIFKRITVELPVGTNIGGFTPRRFNTLVRDLTAKQRFGLNALMYGLMEEEVTLQMGGKVNNQVNAVRATLEIIAENAREAFTGEVPPNAKERS